MAGNSMKVGLYFNNHVIQPAVHLILKSELNTVKCEASIDSYFHRYFNFELTQTSADNVNLTYIY